MLSIKKYWGIIRRIRFLHVINNLFHYSDLKKNKYAYRKYGLQKSIIRSIAHRDFKLALAEKPWLDVENAVERIKNDGRLNQFTPEIQGQLLKWPQKGYAILDEFVSSQLIDEVNKDLEHLLKTGEIQTDYTNSRVMNLYTKSEAVKKIATNKELLKVLSFILGKKVVPFQTINFTHGSQQKTHSDSIHMTTHPKGYLIAIWIALEDLDPGSGLLHYYPGSHKLPYVMGEDFKNSNNKIFIGEDFYENYEIKIAETIEQKNLKKEIFPAKKGDLLIWHANLLHGGEPRTNMNATRKSLVVHYFCEGDVINYHEITQRPAIIKEF